LLGQSIEILVSERSRERHAEYRADYVADPHMRPMGIGFDLHGRRKDDSEFPAEISLCPIEMEEGLLTAARICDITGRKWMQERLQRQDRLAAVGQLAAGVAHDFNTLLTGIIGFADMLQKREDMPEQARARLVHILTQGQRGAHLVRQILDFSRASISQLQPLDLASFLRQATNFQGIIPENIHIALEVDPGTHHIRADPARIRQVLTNLAMNARDAMPEGGELAFRLSGFTRKLNERPPCLGMPPGEWVVLSVSDTGTGIPAEVLPRVFEPFFTTKDPGKGTGLGLAQVYGIVEQHEGYINTESQEGEGTTVAIYLPTLVVGKDEGVPHRPANTKACDELPTS
jgi:signal transduction histidine kinase